MTKVKNSYYSAAVLAILSINSISALAAPCPSNGSGGVDNTGGTCEVTGTTNRITANNGPGNPIVASNVTVTVPFGTAVSALNGSSVIFGPNTLIQDVGGGGFTGLLADGMGSIIDANSNGIQIRLPGALDAVRAQNGGQVFLGEGTLIDITPSGGSRVLHAIGAGSQITATGAIFLGTTWGGDRIAHAENGGRIEINDSDITLATGGGGVSSVESNGTGSALIMNNVNINATGAGGNAVGMLATGGAFMALTGGSVNVVGGGVQPHFGPAAQVRKSPSPTPLSASLRIIQPPSTFKMAP